MLKNFDEMVEKVKKNTIKKRVIVASAQTETAIEAAVLTLEGNLADSLLIGDQKVIEEIIKEKFPKYQGKFEIEDTGADLNKACVRSVECVHQGRGDLILKGKADTALLLKASLDKEKGLSTGEVISDVLAFETQERLVMLTDGGIIPYPDLKEKISIIKNAVKVAHAFENPNPRVALLAAVESVNPKMQCTIDAAIISKMNQRNQITGCQIDGPLALDNAIDIEAAKIKGIASQVAGQADILVMPNIEAGNILAKSLTYYAKYRVAHVVVGTQAPILIASRADTAETKMLCIVMGILSS